jgi:hypothetical protein
MTAAAECAQGGKVMIDAPATQLSTLGTPVVGLAIGWATTAALRQAASASEGNHYRDSRRLLRKTERKIKCD